MLYIHKETAPVELTEKVIEIIKSDEWKTADENNVVLLRSFFDRLDKQIIRDALVKEQHGLCAYCMKRIEANDKMNIEHYRPIKSSKDHVLDFSNMLGCCKGGRDETSKEQRVLCCDAAKKDQTITIDPCNRSMMEKIYYRKDGRIYVNSADKKLKYDIDHVLQLNGILDKNGNMKRDTSTQIVMGRRVAYRNYENFMQALHRKFGNNESKIKTYVRKRIEDIEALETYPEYAGVILYFLRRRMRGDIQ